MVVDDAYLHCVPFFPKKDETPLLLQSCAPIALKVTRQLLKLIAGRNSHIVDILYTHSRNGNANPAFWPMADIIIFRKQRNGQRNLEITLVGYQQNLMTGT